MRRDAPFWLAANFGSLGLAIYGFEAWYFPEGEASLVLAAIVIPLGVVTAIFFCKHMPRANPTSKIRKSIACAAILVLVPVLLWMAFGVGLPALVMKVAGPDAQIPATVRIKREGGKGCMRKVSFVEYSSLLKDELCVSSHDFNTLQEGQRVVLSARKNIFGIRVFAIEAG